ncbi:HAD family hydrolase [Desulfuribacillus alkaliarsenatis]|uniref:Haloacid dehalogenase n=1 Tax=Desulfuribacillus alkaliarsenatis TaxID=766136 RepID=A0A1E5G285_9FIRM|nr:HAD family hydrolase [Desulfuribacillus alkaliarsenatis]OEF97090.1 haloacid dehalogenase [Desulfuribacillus alkaliarsenatis]
MKKAILFDLDGTLLPMDTDRFIKNYMRELAKKVAHIVDPEEFSKALWAGTSAMIKNRDDSITNEQVFEESFLPLIKLEKQAIWPTLDEFYANTFPTLSHLSSPTPIAKQVIEAALKQGYKVAVATNPVFPKVAIYERIKWAGLDDSVFSHITVYENSYFTKPHPQYYQHISNQLQVNPENCIMVGNDKQEDMAASAIGMKTYLVEDWLIDRGESLYNIDGQGTLAHLYEQLVNRSGLFK